MLTPEGRLTVASHIEIINGRKIPIVDSRYTPVPCYNQIPPELDLCSAVEWYLERRKVDF